MRSTASTTISDALSNISNHFSDAKTTMTNGTSTAASGIKSAYMRNKGVFGKMKSLHHMVRPLATRCRVVRRGKKRSGSDRAPTPPPKDGRGSYTSFSPAGSRLPLSAEQSTSKSSADGRPSTPLRPSSPPRREYTLYDSPPGDPPALGLGITVSPAASIIVRPSTAPGLSQPGQSSFPGLTEARDLVIPRRPLPGDAGDSQGTPTARDGFLERRMSNVSASSYESYATSDGGLAGPYEKVYYTSSGRAVPLDSADDSRPMSLVDRYIPTGAPRDHSTNREYDTQRSPAVSVLSAAGSVRSRKSGVSALSSASGASHYRPAPPIGNPPPVTPDADSRFLQEMSIHPEQLDNKGTGQRYSSSSSTHSNAGSSVAGSTRQEIVLPPSPGSSVSSLQSDVEDKSDRVAQDVYFGGKAPRESGGISVGKWPLRSYSFEENGEGDNPRRGRVSIDPGPGVSAAASLEPEPISPERFRTTDLHKPLPERRSLDGSRLQSPSRANHPPDSTEETLPPGGPLALENASVHPRAERTMGYTLLDLLSLLSGKVKATLPSCSPTQAAEIISHFKDLKSMLENQEDDNASIGDMSFSPASPNHETGDQFAMGDEKSPTSPAAAKHDMMNRERPVPRSRELSSANDDRDDSPFRVLLNDRRAARLAARGVPNALAPSKPPGSLPVEKD